MSQQLDRLTDQERHLLRLLAQGHTAKTIANSEGLSINVVNERLRSARRKAGTTSSRQLARLVTSSEHEKPQKTWDKFIGVEPVPDALHEVPAQGLAPVVRRLWATGGLTMIAAILTAATLFAVQVEKPDTTTLNITETAQTASGALIQLNVEGDTQYLVSGSIVRSDGLHLGTVVKPLGEYGLMSIQIEMDCAAQKWRSTSISFYNQDGTLRRSSTGPSGWATRNVQGIAEQFCIQPAS